MSLGGRISGAGFFQPQKSGAGFLVRDFCPGFARAESGAGFWDLGDFLGFSGAGFLGFSGA